MTGVNFLKLSSPMYGTSLGSNKVETKLPRRITCNKTNIIPPTFSKLHLQTSSPLQAMWKYRLCSLSTNKKLVTSSLRGTDQFCYIDGFDVNEFLQKAKEVLLLLYTHPDLHRVIVAAGGSILSIIGMWAIIPPILRIFHILITEAIVLPVGLNAVPFEKSFLGAFEDPLKYYVTYIAFLKMAVVEAPNMIVSQKLTLVARISRILAYMLFFIRLMTYYLTRIADLPMVGDIMRHNLLTLDVIFSLSVITIGSVVIYEACRIEKSIWLLYVLMGGLLVINLFKNESEGDNE